MCYDMPMAGSNPKKGLPGAGFWVPRQIADHPGQVSPAIERFARAAMPVLRVLFRPRLEGTENLPASGPYLLVANHSAGLGVAEIFCFAASYLTQLGPDKPLAGFALPLSFRVYPVSAMMASVGAIPSTYEAAEHTFAKGVPILVFPGGDYDTLRPIWRANLVDFGGRLGFLRMARKAGVPLVPLGIRGSHYTAPVLIRSQLLAWLLVQPRLVGQKRWGISGLGLLVAILIAALAPWSVPVKALVIWLWLGSPLVLMPWIPWTIRMRIGKPIANADLFGQGPEAGSEAELRRALTVVEAAVQQQVNP